MQPWRTRTTRSINPGSVCTIFVILFVLISVHYFLFILWICLIIPWLFCGYSMVILWIFCGYSVVIPWLFRGYSVVILILLYWLNQVFWINLIGLFLLFWPASQVLVLCSYCLNQGDENVPRPFTYKFSQIRRIANMFRLACMQQDDANEDALMHPFITYSDDHREPTVWFVFKLRTVAIIWNGYSRHGGLHLLFHSALCCCLGSSYWNNCYQTCQIIGFSVIEDFFIIFFIELTETSTSKARNFTLFRQKNSFEVARVSPFKIFIFYTFKNAPISKSEWHLKDINSRWKFLLCVWWLNFD